MRKSIFKVLGAFLFALTSGLFTLTGFAQTGNSYYFPGITINNNITIGNLNPSPTTATINFYDNSGKLNSVSIDLLPGMQTRVNPSTVSLTTFTGSVVITSQIPLTISTDQFEGNTAFDFTYPSPLGTNLLIPFVAAEAASVDVNIFNPGPNQAEVKVVLVQSSGAHTDSRTATLDPLHSTTITLPSSTNASYAFVTTSNILRPVSPVAASAVIRNFAPGGAVTGAVPRTDFTVVPALPQNQYTKTSTVPFFAQGPDYFTLVQIDNLTNAQQTISVQATQADGTNFPGTANPASIVLPPYGSIRQEMATMFGSQTTGFVTGTITATSQGTLFNGNPTSGPPGPLTASTAIGNLAEPSFAVMLPTASQSVFALELRGTGREFFSGLTLRNPNTTNDAHVTMSFVLDSATTLSTVPVTIPKGQTQTTTLADLMPEAVGNGYILFKSDTPITVVGLDGRSDNTALATRLPVFASAQFNPPAQTSLLITGTVRDPSAGINGQNIGVPNVALSLSGPVEATTASDLAGTYYFRDLPAGRYSLSALPVGFTASPTNRTIVLTNANSRGNDFAIGVTAAGILTVNPASAQQVSSTPGTTASPLQIAVQGSNFIQPTTFTGNIFTQNINKFTTGTVFVFDQSQVPTTVSSPTFLTATVPPSNLVTTGVVQVRVRNLGPSGDFIDSAPVPFIIGTTPPTLTSVTGVPSPLIAGKVASSFQITVNGSGFTPATRVRVNFLDRPTTFINQNQVVGTVLPSDLTIPGFVPITVQNPNTVDSMPFQLPLLYPIPVLNTISPGTLTAQVELNAQPVLVTVNGSDFSQSPNNPLDYATVLVNGTRVSTTYISTTQLTALIPANVTSVPGVLQVAVTNPDPSLAASNAQPLFVNNPIAVITALNAGGVTWNPNSPPNDFFIQPVVVTGKNFSPSAVAWVSLPCDNLGLRQALSTVRNSAEQIIANIPIRCAGNYSIAIANPQPGGGLSAPATLNVPSVAAATSADTNPVLQSGLKTIVEDAGTAAPTAITSSSTQSTALTLTPRSVTAEPAATQSPVATAQPGLSLNAQPMLFVNNPVASITSVNAEGVTWNPNAPKEFTQPVVITGTNFMTNSVVGVSLPCDNLGMRQVSSSVNSAGQIVASVPVRCAGDYSIAIANPAPGGGLSAPWTLNVPSVAADVAAEGKPAPQSGPRTNVQE
jgi:hypothetical protein